MEDAIRFELASVGERDEFLLLNDLQLRQGQVVDRDGHVVGSAPEDGCQVQIWRGCCQGIRAVSWWVDEGATT